MLNNMGLGMIIRAKDMASAVFKRVGKSIQGAAKAGQRFGKGMGQLASAARSGAMAFAPMTLAIGFAGKKAADFEQGMANVKAVMSDAEGNFTALSNKAKEVGATTSKSATEAAQGLELLGRAGFDSKQAMDALLPVVSAAEADSLDLARTTEIVTDTMNAMGISSEEAGRVADVLAVTSANTATNIDQLGEAFKYSAPIASQLGVSLEDLALSAGLVANAGLKGSVGGTAMKNMLLKLAKPTSEAKKIVKDLGLTFDRGDGSMKNFKEVVGDLITAIPEMGGNLDQTAKLAELFGLRGQGAAANLVKQFKKLEKEGKLKGLIDKLAHAEGQARKMADIKLDTFKGQLTILGSAVEGLAIEAFSPLLGTIKDFATGAGSFIQDVAVAMQVFADPGGVSDEAAKRFTKMGETAKAVALGIREGIDWVKGAFESVNEFLLGLRKRLESALGADGVKKLAKFATVIGIILAVAAPILAAFAGIAFVVSSVVVPALSGLGSVLGAIFSPWGLVIAGAIAILWGLRDKIVAFGQGLVAGFMGPWESIKSSLSSIWENIKSIYDSTIGALGKGLDQIDIGAVGERTSSVFGGTFATIMEYASALVEGFKRGWEGISPVLTKVVASLGGVWDAILNVVEALGLSDGASEGATDGVRTFGEVLATIFGFAAAAVGVAAEVIAGAINIIAAVVGGVVSVLTSAVNIIVGIVEVIADLFAGNWSSAWAGAKSIVFEVVKGIITIVGTIVQAIAAAVDAIGKIFGKDLGAKKFMASVQKDLVNDVEKMIKGQEQVARERAAQRAKARPKPAPTVAAAPLPRAGAAPAVAAAQAGTDQTVSAIDRLGTSLKQRPVKATIDLTTKLLLDGRVLAEEVKKVTKELQAREGG